MDLLENWIMVSLNKNFAMFHTYIEYVDVNQIPKTEIGKTI